MTWSEPGNYPCCHIGCVNEADWILGKSHEDYIHMCKDHKDEYVNDGDVVIPIIRKGRESTPKEDTKDA